MAGERLERFEVNRRRPFGLAYRLLGEASEAEDVIAWTDGGGEAPAARQPVIGREKVLRSLTALGSHADLHGVPGAAEHATAVATAEAAAQLHERMRTASAVAVVGGGLTGIEVATELAESHPDRTVQLVTGQTLGVTLTGRGQDHLHRTLDRLASGSGSGRP
jgi:hypothetical protein